MTVELISVGTELLLGNIVNTNAAYLSTECAALGLSMYTQTVVGDNDKRLSEVFKEAVGRADVVILGGGLGPTEDDLTKETVCNALGLSLHEDEKARDIMEKYLTKAGFTPTDNNYKQALVPDGAIVMYNRNGTAPGLIIEKDGHSIILLPGPPNEMIPMFEEYVSPYLKNISKECLFSCTIKECGIGESLLETKLLDIIDKQNNPTIATYAKTGCCEIRITAKADTEDAAKELVKPVAKEIKKRLGNAVYSTNASDNLEDAVISLLKEHDLKISTAESCTGGLVAAKLVNVSGASDVFTHGFITYSNKAKRKVLGVDRDTLKKYSAVSKEVAKEMVKGCICTADSDVAVAVTGYAGPGDSKEEPKGLVYIACSVKDKVIVEKFNFNGNRQKIRESAAVKALDMVRTAILAAYK
ncbi:MAG: competence/damage-inducible protein A [Butyrivibrio sp.]